MSSEIVLRTALAYLDSDTPNLQECFTNLLGLLQKATGDEFERITMSMDAVWEVAWCHREELCDREVQLVAQVAVLFVHGCGEFSCFRPWGTSHLPHLLLYCAVDLRDYIYIDPFIEGIHLLLMRSPARVSSSESAVDWYTSVEELIRDLDPEVLASMFLDSLINHSTTTGMKLYSAMTVAILCFLQPRMQEILDVADVLDRLDSAIRRPCEGMDNELLARSMILYSYCEYVLVLFDNKIRLRLLMSGRYDLFSALADGLTCYSRLEEKATDHPERIYETYGLLILALQAPFTSLEHSDILTKIPEPLVSFVSKTRETACKKMPALYEAIRDTPLASLNSPEVKHAWGKTFGILVDFSLAIGAHPFCASHSCMYHLRPLPNGAAFKKCGGCMNVRYCSKGCQKSHRKTHKEKCGKILRAQ